MKRVVLAALLSAPTPVFAQVDRFEEGQFLTITGYYDSDLDQFTPDVYEGERDACFRLDSVDADDLVLALFKGDHRPWWNEKTIYKPGGNTDKWSTSDSYRDNHSDANYIDGLHGLFTSHPACP